MRTVLEDFNLRAKEAARQLQGGPPVVRSSATSSTRCVLGGSAAGASPTRGHRMRSIAQMRKAGTAKVALGLRRREGVRLVGGRDPGRCQCDEIGLVDRGEQDRTIRCGERDRHPDTVA